MRASGFGFWLALTLWATSAAYAQAPAAPQDSISLSASGRTLAVGAHLKNSNATGIDGERENKVAPNAGAAYLY